MIYRLADRLSKTVSEIMDLPETEIAGWIAHFELCESEAKRP